MSTTGPASEAILNAKPLTMMQKLSLIMSCLKLVKQFGIMKTAKVLNKFGVAYFTYRVNFDNEIFCHIGPTAPIPSHGLIHGG